MKYDGDGRATARFFSGKGCRHAPLFTAPAESLFRILCKYLFSEVAVQAVTELDNKAAHCHTPVPQWHRPFL